MGMTISSMATNYYNVYKLMSNIQNSTDSVDTQDFLEENYGISDLSSALSAASSSDDTSFESLENIFNHSKSLYQLSQLEIYSTLSESESDNEELDFSSVTTARSAAQYILKSQEAEDSYSTIADKISKYKSYLTDSSNSVLDLFV